MKRNDWLVFMAFIIVGAVVVSLMACSIYRSQLHFWQERSEETFVLTLQSEMVRRGGHTVYRMDETEITLGGVDSLDRGLKTYRAEITDGQVSMEVNVSTEQHIYNIDPRFAVRRAHSKILRNGQPLRADRLQERWNETLAADGWTGRTAVRVRTTDAHGRVRQVNSLGYDRMARADSLLTRYIGVASEVGVTGYLHLSWWQALTKTDVASMILILSVCALLASLREEAVACYRRLRKRQTDKATGVDDKPDVVYVVAPSPQLGPVVFQLDATTQYDTSTCLLSGIHGENRLTPLPDRLLQAFLGANDYSLTHNQIYDLLWPGPNNYYPQRLHTTITRLRAILDHTAGWTIESYGGVYRLKSKRQ